MAEIEDRAENIQIKIAGETIPPGVVKQLEIPVARLPTQTLICLPVTVINGLESGARLWLSAAIHGDEINGVEIIRQVVNQVNPRCLKGTLIAVPIVNVFGFIEQSRYLPDRRDLNRCFPGLKMVPLPPAWPTSSCGKLFTSVLMV